MDSLDTKVSKEWGQAQHLAGSSSPAEIWQQLGWAKIGFIIAGLSAFLTMSFFIVQFFAGADIGDFENWGGVQWFYAFLGALLSASITGFQLFLFASGQTKQAVLSVVVAVAFGVFCEVSATMEREQSAVKHRSSQSEVYKASVKAIGALSGAGATLSPAQVALSEATAKLKQWQTDGKKHSVKSVENLKLKISALESQATMSATQQAGVLKDTINTAKDLEQDEANHAQMIRLFMSFGMSAVWASFCFSLIIIGVFEYAFHYMGQRLALLKNALHLLGYDTARNRPEPPLLKRADRKVSSIPFPAPVSVPVSGLARSLGIPSHPSRSRSSQSSNHPTSQTSGEMITSPLGIPSHTSGETSLGSALQVVADTLYPAWLEEVRAGRMSQAKEPCQKFIWKQTTKPDSKEGLTAPETAKIWADWKSRAVKDGALVQNPKYQAGNRQPEYVLA
jgi:hypothetical protein